MKNIIAVRELIKSILRKRNYLILFICSSTLLFLAFYVLTLATTTNQSLGIFVMMNGALYATMTFFLLAGIALLFGIYVSLIAYALRIKQKHKNKANKTHGIFGSVGILVGLFSAGCPMCGAFLFGLFGMPLALFFMPFKGIELRLLALVMLGISVYLVGRSLVRCKTKS